MLPVFSVILEYRKDGRNSSDRPTVRPQSLYCMYSLHSRHFKFVFFSPIIRFAAACQVFLRSCYKYAFSISIQYYCIAK